MKKKICYAVSINRGKLALIRFFVLNTSNDKIFAVVLILHERSDSPISVLEGGKHFTCVCKTDDIDVIPIHEIREKVFFIQAGDDESVFVARNPNRHGHAVFK